MTPKKRGARLATLRRIRRYLRGYRVYLVLALALATASTLLTLYIPRLVGRAIDCVVGVGDVDFRGVGNVCVQIAGCAAFVALAQTLMTLCNNRTAFGVARDVRNDAFRKLEAAPLSYIDARQYGESVARIVTDADVFTDGLLLGFSHLFTGVVAIVGVLFFMLSISVPITLVVVALTPISFVVAGFISKRTFQFFMKQSECRGALSGYVNASMKGARVIQAFNRTAAEEQALSEFDERLSSVTLKATFFSSLTNPATRFVNMLVYASVGVAGGFAVLNGRLTVGSLVTFLSYADQYSKPFNEISGVVAEFQNALACAERLFELVDETEQPSDPENATIHAALQGRVEFNHVSFSYTPTRPLIKDFSLKVKPGSHVAIVGPTGCGKTTLVNLLMRFYDVTDGAILIDDVDSRKMTRASLRDGFGMVLQETWLKSGTIRENILMGATYISETELQRVARACRLDAFVERLPKGYDSQVSEGGEEFSQGQRQLLCIARVMARRPKILILDEATSSIDTRAELKVQAAFDSLMTGKTTFVVAHRLSTIRNADVILAMKDGAIVEQGTHDELLAKRGYYYQLYMSQFPTA